MRLLEEESTGDSLAFSWNAVSCENTDTCSYISSYPYNLVNVDRTGMIINGEATDTSVTIPNLEPCTFYRFSVAAMNDAGITGSFSGQINGTTTLAGKCIPWTI